MFVGECFWEHPPTPAEIAAAWPGITAEDHYDLPELIDLAIMGGDFESGSMADAEEWLADHHDHPLADETRKMADDHLSVWLRASRGLLGVAYLTLIPLP